MKTDKPEVMANRAMHLRGGRTTLFMAVMLFAVAGAGFLAGTVPPHSERALGISLDGLDFGEVWEQQRFQHTFSIKNASPRSVRIASIQTGCGCMSIDPKSLQLSPGEKRAIHLTLDLSLTDASPRRSQAFSTLVSALVESPTGIVPIHWQLVGSVRPHPIRAIPARVDFGNRIARGWPTIPEVVAIAGDQRIKDVRVQSTSPLATVRNWRNPLDGVYRLEIQPALDAPAGMHSFDVEIVGIPVQRENHLPWPPVTIPVIMDAGHDVQIIPPQLHLGAAQVGKDSEDTVFLSSRNAAFTVLSATVVPPASLSLLDLGRNHRGRLFRISCRPNRTGFSRTAVDFAVKQGDDRYVLRLPVSYDAFRAPQP
jgi:hypothetical protein